MEWTANDEKQLAELTAKRVKAREVNEATLAKMIDEAGSGEFLSGEIATIRAFLMQVDPDDLQAIMTVVWVTPK